MGKVTIRTLTENSILRQFVKFGIVGISNTFISTSIAFLIVYIFGDRSQIAIIGNFIGFVASVFNSFFWNKKYVFTRRTENNQKFLFSKVVITYSISLLLSSIFIFVLVDVLFFSSYIALLLRLLIIVPINFLLNKYWAFKDP